MKKYAPFLLLGLFFWGIEYFKYINLANIIVFLTILFGFTTTSYTIVIFHPVARKLYAKKYKDCPQLIHLFKIYRKNFSIQLLTIIYLLAIEKIDQNSTVIKTFFEKISMQSTLQFYFNYLISFAFLFLISLNIYNFYTLIGILENTSIAIAKNMFSKSEES